MKTNAERAILAAMMAGGLLAACSYSRPTLQRAPVTQAKPAPVARSTAPVVVAQAPSAAPAAPPAAAATHPDDPPPAPVAPRDEPPGVIYFEPDVFTVAPAYRPMLEELAGRLKADPSKRLRVQAYADPQGGEEYNRALTEMRAQTVLKLLRSLGVNARQLEAFAFGAEGADADPSGWARHRRVELVFD